MFVSGFVRAMLTRLVFIMYSIFPSYTREQRTCCVIWKIPRLYKYEHFVHALCVGDYPRHGPQFPVYVRVFWWITFCAPDKTIYPVHSMGIVWAVMSKIDFEMPVPCCQNCTGYAESCGKGCCYEKGRSCRYAEPSDVMCKVIRCYLHII